MYIGLHVRYPLLFSDYNEIWIFLRDSEKKISKIKFNINSSSGSWFFYSDGRIDRHNQADSSFLQFCEYAKKSCTISIQALNALSVLATVAIISHTPWIRFTQTRRNCNRNFWYNIDIFLEKDMIKFTRSE